MQARRRFCRSFWARVRWRLDASWMTWHLWTLTSSFSVISKWVDLWGQVSKLASSQRSSWLTVVHVRSNSGCTHTLRFTEPRFNEPSVRWTVFVPPITSGPIRRTCTTMNCVYTPEVSAIAKHIWTVQPLNLKRRMLFIRVFNNMVLYTSSFSEPANEWIYGGKVSELASFQSSWPTVVR